MALNDKNDDDRFRVDLHYAYIPRSRFQVPDGESSGTASGGQRVAIPTGTAVIRGFDFDFRSKDHHIKDIGVMLNGAGRLEVFYGDKNQDDAFTWKVRYAVLRALIRPAKKPGIAAGPQPRPWGVSCAAA